MRQKIFNLKIPLTITVIFMLLPIFSVAKTEVPHRVVNGEEVYEPKKETSKEKTHETNTSAKETKSAMEEGKAKEVHETKTAMKEEAHQNEKPKEPQKEKKEMSHSKTEGMKKYKANKIVSLNEEDPYEIYKPVGIIWFCGVFVVLLIVIFVFT